MSASPSTPRLRPCGICSGKGTQMGDAPGLVESCVTCNGTGSVPASTPDGFEYLTPTKLDLAEKYGLHALDYNDRAPFLIQLCRFAKTQRSEIATMAKDPAYPNGRPAGADYDYADSSPSGKTAAFVVTPETLAAVGPAAVPCGSSDKHYLSQLAADLISGKAFISLGTGYPEYDLTNASVDAGYAILESLAPSSTATIGEPVAWRLKNNPQSDWRHLSYPPAGVGPEAVVEPLYTQLSAITPPEGGTRMDNELIFAALGMLIRRIDACGASPELTRAVTLCSDLRQAIGNKWNPADKYAEQRVRDALTCGNPRCVAPCQCQPPVPRNHHPVA